MQKLSKRLDPAGLDRATDTHPLPRVHRLDVRLGAEALDQLIIDYQAGLTGPELQSRYGLSKGSVLRLLHEAGVQLRRQPVRGGQLAEMVALYESGLSIRQVAAELGLPKTTVQDALPRSGVAMRPAACPRRRRGS